MTKNMTQDDLKHDFYHFNRFPEAKLVPKHVSYVKNYELRKLTFADLTLTRAVQFKPTVCQLRFSEHYSWVLHAKLPPKHVSHGHVGVRKYGDL